MFFHILHIFGISPVQNFFFTPYQWPAWACMQAMASSVHSAEGPRMRLNINALVNDEADLHEKDIHRIFTYDEADLHEMILHRIYTKNMPTNI